MNEEPKHVEALPAPCEICECPVLWRVGPGSWRCWACDPPEDAEIEVIAAEEPE